jgi:hypothetical protein
MPISTSRRSSFLRLAAVALTAWVAYGAWSRHAESQRLEAVAKNDAAAAILIESLRARLPSGSREADVLQFLRTNYPQYSTFPTSKQTRYAISVGEEPSAFWYCGSFTAYVTVVVESGILSHVDTWRWSDNCL